MNRDIHFAIDPDTLAILNKEKFGDREELYFKLLPEQYYSFPETLPIPAGQSTSLLPVEYSLEGIDMADMWVLPIKIVSNDSYNYAVNPHKHYSKILIQPVPFNEFSGNYSGTKLLGYVNDDKTVPLNSSSHRAYAPYSFMLVCAVSIIPTARIINSTAGLPVRRCPTARTTKLSFGLIMKNWNW